MLPLKLRFKLLPNFCQHLAMKLGSARLVLAHAKSPWLWVEAFLAAVLFYHKSLKCWHLLT